MGLLCVFFVTLAAAISVAPTPCEGTTPDGKSYDLTGLQNLNGGNGLNYTNTNDYEFYWNFCTELPPTILAGCSQVPTADTNVLLKLGNSCLGLSETKNAMVLSSYVGSDGETGVTANFTGENKELCQSDANPTGKSIFSINIVCGVNGEGGLPQQKGVTDIANCDYVATIVSPAGCPAGMSVGTIVLVVMASLLVVYVIGTCGYSVYKTNKGEEMEAGDDRSPLFKHCMHYGVVVEFGGLVADGCKFTCQSVSMAISRCRNKASGTDEYAEI